MWASCFSFTPVSIMQVYWESSNLLEAWRTWPPHLSFVILQRRLYFCFKVTSHFSKSTWDKTFFQINSLIKMGMIKVWTQNLLTPTPPEVSETRYKQKIFARSPLHRNLFICFCLQIKQAPLTDPYKTGVQVTATGQWNKSTCLRGFACCNFAPPC